MAMAYPSQSATIVARIMREQLGLANAGARRQIGRSSFTIHHIAPNKCNMVFPAPSSCIQAVSLGPPSVMVPMPLKAAIVFLFVIPPTSPNHHGLFPTGLDFAALKRNNDRAYQC
jgi:hypothetical protein